MSSKVDAKSAADDQWKDLGVYSASMRTPQRQQEYYDKWGGEDYDKMAQHVYNGPQQLAKFASKHLQHDDLILVVGAGSGLEGDHLSKAGFKNLHAHDGSASMLEVAEKKGHFKKYMHVLLYPNQKSELPSETYGAALGVGIFYPGALDERFLDDMIRTVKPNGKFIFGVRTMFLTPLPDWDYHHDLRHALQQLQDDKRLSLIEEKQMENFTESHGGTYFAFKVLSH